MIKLYTNPLSGYCHRVELLLSLLSLGYEVVRINLAQPRRQLADLLAANSWGQIPVLVDGDTTVVESTAILVYLANKTGATRWLPRTPLEAARVEAWLSRAGGAGIRALSDARMICRFGARGNLAEAQKQGSWLLSENSPQAIFWRMLFRHWRT